MAKHEERVCVPYSEIEHETCAATLFSIDGKKVWLPKSQTKIHFKEREVELPEWLAIDKDLV